MGENGFLGIDCGGTLCRVALSVQDRRVDFVGKGANFTTSPEACAVAITDSLHSLADKAGVSMSALCEAQGYAGVAGIMDDLDAEALRQALPLRSLVVQDDKAALAVGALGRRDGFVASVGTGSFFARRAGSSVETSGGWGLVLGDEASGGWLGRELLKLCLQAQDGLIPHTALTAAVLDEFGGPVALVDFARDADPAEFARLAPGIAGAAAAGDPQGQALMRRGGDWIEAALRALGWRPKGRVVMPGRLGAAYHAFLPDVVAEAVTPAHGTALDGALALARMAHA